MENISFKKEQFDEMTRVLKADLMENASKIFQKIILLRLTAKIIQSFQNLYIGN